jgi:hypothetical protein
MENRTVYPLLTYAGMLPFVGCALMPFFGLQELWNLGSYDYIAAAYALAIVCFLCGAHWGTYLYHVSAAPDNLFISSNVIVVACWFAFLMAAQAITLFVLILAFLCLLVMDYRLLKAGLLTDFYFRMRTNATIVAVVALAIIIVMVRR